MNNPLRSPAPRELENKTDKMELTTEVKAHDRFNIVCLTLVTLVDLIYLRQTTDLELIGSETIGNNDRHLSGILIAGFGCYLAVDVIWVLLIPKCVMSSPENIVAHHLLSLVGLFLSLTIPQFSWHTALILLVETNTLFLTIRRNAQKDSVVHFITNVLFYVTWVVLRLIFFPVMVVFLCQEYARYSASVGTYVNVVLLAPILQGALTAMSYMWTYEMLVKLLRRCNEPRKSV